MHHCALLSFKCGETVLKRLSNQYLRVQHKQKKKRKNIGKKKIKKKSMTIQNYKPKKTLERVRILKTQIVKGRNTITKLCFKKNINREETHIF